MELRHVAGKTWVIEATDALLCLYRLNERDAVLMDTGIARADREGLTELLERTGIIPRGIICTHAHYDHTGNAAFLREKFDGKIAAQLIEAGIGATPESYRANYAPLTYGQCRIYLREPAFPTDVVIGIQDDRLSFCGTEFGVMQLPGHSAGQIGVITPDNVAYLADSLMGPALMASAKLPTSMNVALDMDTKRSLLDLDCDAYVVAHRDVLCDIRDLVAQNLTFYTARLHDLLACLRDGMTTSEWLMAFGTWAGFRTHSAYKLCVIRRNFDNFAAYLEDSGQVSIQRDATEKRYYHAAGN